MHLLEISLQNWRSYRNATFRFPKPHSGRNVILVGAQNGTGKTSLLIAIYLGLFGRQSMHLIEGVRISSFKEDETRTYRNLIERNLHRPAIKQDMPLSRVSLKFETNAGEIIITRTWNFTRGGRLRDLSTRDAEEVRIESEGYPKILSWQEANDQISEMLFHSNVMPCFFFDGEQAQERVEAAGGRALLDAVNTLYGTGILDELNTSLKTFIQNEQHKLKRDFGSVRTDELELNREKLERNKQELEKINKSLGEQHKKKEMLEAERNRITLEIHQLVGDSATDIEEYAKNIKALDIELISARDKLVKGLASLAFPIAMHRNATCVKSIIEGEQIRDRWLLLREEAGNKANQIIDQVFPKDIGSAISPPLSDAQLIQLKSRLEKALEALWSPPPKGCSDGYLFSFLKDSDRSAVISKIDRIRATGDCNLVQAAYEWDRINAENREAYRLFENIRTVQPKLKELKDDFERISPQIREYDAELTGLNIRAEGLRTTIKDLKAQIGQMEQRRELADPLQAKIDVAYRVRSVIDEAREAVIPLCKKNLEERCTLHFHNMISDEYRNFKVRFDHEREPVLEGPALETVYVSSLSGAQKRVFGLAFTLAVADLSGQAAPIVVDTPVGNMDSKYRERVLRYVAEAAPGQVVYLSHDEEVSPEYKLKLDDRIVKTLLVTFESIQEGSGMSSVVENSYFGGH